MSNETIFHIIFLVLAFGGFWFGYAALYSVAKYEQKMRKLFGKEWTQL